MQDNTKKYLVPGKRYYVVRAIDGILSLLIRIRPDAAIGIPRKILICDIAHLGDVVIATSVIPVLKNLFPDARLGFLVGSWSKCVIEGHPHISWIHTLDHPKLNRSPVSRIEKFRRYANQRRKALAEIKAVGYDVAVELLPYFANTIPLLWQAGIPVRVGYTSGGYGSLLTHPLDWVTDNRHIAENHFDLLRFLGASDERHKALLHYDLPQNYCESAADAPVGGKYLVVHMGSGAESKNWLAEKWRQLVIRLVEEGNTVVFTGSSQKEDAEIQRVSEGVTNCVNLCGKLNWPQFVDVIRHAGILISVDTVAGHLAAAFDKKAVVIFNGVNNISQWRPYGEQIRVVTCVADCSPCYLPRGCMPMSCIRNVEVDEVFDQYLQLKN
ncbi:MAG: glycosyltransferase family 9 protein [Geobacter sp.]|nr:glycosyltransferase family 9 protein [Geobacter sp.]